jgi:hypothetical protein
MSTVIPTVPARISQRRLPNGMCQKFNGSTQISHLQNAAECPSLQDQPQPHKDAYRCQCHRG